MSERESLLRKVRVSRPSSVHHNRPSQQPTVGTVGRVARVATQSRSAVSPFVQ